MNFLWDSFVNMFKKPSTRKYPTQPLKPTERARGELQFDPSKCIGCKLCEDNCPSECIKVNAKGKIDFDLTACLFCGMCNEICPTKAITFDKNQELATKRKDLLVKQYL